MNKLDINQIPFYLSHLLTMLLGLLAAVFFFVNFDRSNTRLHTLPKYYRHTNHLGINPIESGNKLYKSFKLHREGCYQPRIWPSDRKSQSSFERKTHNGWFAFGRFRVRNQCVSIFFRNPGSQTSFKRPQKFLKSLSLRTFAEDKDVAGRSLREHGPGKIKIGLRS